MAFIVLAPVRIRGRSMETSMLADGVRPATAPRWEEFRASLEGTQGGIWAGRLATFTAKGRALKEVTIRTELSKDAQEQSDVIGLVTRAAGSGDLLVKRTMDQETTIGFEDGSFSWGPRANRYPFEVESCMSFQNQERVRIIHAFNSDGELHGFAVCVEIPGESPPPSFYKTFPAEAKDIAGNWTADNLICYNENGLLSCTSANLTRTYSNQPSSSPALVLLPYGMTSVVQPRITPEREFSIGVGWLASHDQRLVMIRKYNANGWFTRTAYRTEHRQRRNS